MGDHLEFLQKAFGKSRISADWEELRTTSQE